MHWMWIWGPSKQTGVWVHTQAASVCDIDRMEWMHPKEYSSNCVGAVTAASGLRSASCATPGTAVDTMDTRYVFSAPVRPPSRHRSFEINSVPLFAFGDQSAADNGGLQPVDRQSKQRFWSISSSLSHDSLSCDHHNSYYRHQTKFPSHHQGHLLPWADIGSSEVFAAKRRCYKTFVSSYCRTATTSDNDDDDKKDIW